MPPGRQELLQGQRQLLLLFGVVVVVEGWLPRVLLPPESVRLCELCPRCNAADALLRLLPERHQVGAG